MAELQEICTELSKLSEDILSVTLGKFQIPNFKNSKFASRNKDHTS
jgi:hypothetical protein